MAFKVRPMTSQDLNPTENSLGIYFHLSPAASADWAVKGCLALESKHTVNSFLSMKEMFFSTPKWLNFKSIGSLHS